VWISLILPDPAPELGSEHEVFVETEARSFTATSEPVQPSRIVDENLFTDRRVGRPNRELVQQAAIVDRVPHPSRLAKGGVFSDCF
jgi:hypothetical protein